MARLARSSALQFGVQGLQTILGFAVTLYFANRLGAALLGKYFLTLAIVNWTMLPTTGIQKAVTKRVSEGEFVNRLYTTGILLQGAFIAVVSAIILLLSKSVESYVGYDAIWFIAAIFSLKVFTTFYIGLLRAEGKYSVAAGTEGLWHVSRPILQIGLFFGMYGFFSLLWGEIGSMLLSIAISAILLKTRLAKPTIDDFERIYTFARYAWLSSLKTRSYSWMDTLILGVFVFPEVIGVYEVAWRTTAAFILLPTAISKVVFPHISNRAANGDMKGVARTVRRSLYFGGALSIPGLFGALVIGPGVLRLYGPEFTSGAVILIILSVARIIQSYETLLLQTLDALDLPEVTFRIALVFAVSNLVMNGIFIWIIGPVGAAIATALSIGISTFLAGKVIRERLPLSLNWQPFVAQIMAAGSMGLVVHATSHVVPNGAVGTLMLVGLGVFTYGGLLLILSSEIRNLVFGLIEFPR